MAAHTKRNIIGNNLYNLMIEFFLDLIPIGGMGIYLEKKEIK